MAKEDNILFIGNGFDLHNEMKTGYIDYLKSLKISNEQVDDIYNMLKIYECFAIFQDFHIFINSRANENKDFKVEYIDFSHFDQIGTTFKIFEDYEKKEKFYFDNMLNVHKQFKTEKSSDIVFNNLSDQNKYGVLCAILYSILYQKTIFNFTIDENIHSKSYESFLDKHKNDSDLEKIFNIDFSEVKKKLFDLQNSHSVFALYLELIHKKDIASSRNIDELTVSEYWIDLENILYHNQFPTFESTINSSEASTKNLLMYRNFIKIFGDDLDIESDFKKFKLNFSKYIRKQQNLLVKNKNKKAKVENLLSNINNKLELTKIYNFNYSDYINSVFDNINLDILIDNIHGSIEDGDKIVFGSNHHLFLDELISYNEKLKAQNLNTSIRKNEYHYKLTKIYQVLEISQTRKTIKISKATSLTILGLSIGRQDFEYLHSVIATNPKEIELNIIWNTYKNSKGEKVNNLESLTSATYEMLESYKNLYKDLTVHKMILENRIKFIHLDEFIPKSADK